MALARFVQRIFRYRQARFFRVRSISCIENETLIFGSNFHQFFTYLYIFLFWMIFIIVNLNHGKIILISNFNLNNKNESIIYRNGNIALCWICEFSFFFIICVISSLGDVKKVSLFVWSRVSVATGTGYLRCNNLPWGILNMQYWSYLNLSLISSSVLLAEGGGNSSSAAILCIMNLAASNPLCGSNTP